MRILAVNIADLRLPNTFNFRPRFRKFYINIEIRFYLREIFMFLPSNTKNQFYFFESKFGKIIKSLEFRLTKIPSLLFDLIAFFLLTCSFSSLAKQLTFFEFKFKFAALAQSMALLFFTVSSQN